VAGRFRLYTDADIRGQIVEGLIRRGWDVVRAVDAFREKTKDPVHFAEAARQGRVLVAHDIHQLKLALDWLEQRRSFTGFLTWPQLRQKEWSDGVIVEAFEDLAQEDDPFPKAYPIRYLKPRI